MFFLSLDTDGIADLDDLMVDYSEIPQDNVKMDKKEVKTMSTDKGKPTIDLDSLAFATDEVRAKALSDYEQALIDYHQKEYPNTCKNDKGFKSILLKNKIATFLYSLLIFIELFFCVPYNYVEITLSKQNVIHSQIIGGGFASLFEIFNTTAHVTKSDPVDTFFKINTSMLFAIITLTTVVFIAILFNSYLRSKPLWSTDANNNLRNNSNAQKI